VKEFYRGSVLLFLLFQFSLAATAQQIENLSSSFDGHKVIITYDLIYADSSRRFEVELFSSLDSYSSPLAHTSGFVGKKVKPTKGLTIFWEPRKALPADFDKDIDFKVKATIVALPPPVIQPPFVVVAKPEIKATAEQKTITSKITWVTVLKTNYRRGTTINIRWKNGKPDDLITIELHTTNTKQVLQSKVNNKGEATILLPFKQKTMEGYSLKIIPNSRPEDAAVGTSFKIKNRVPLLVKVLPLAAGAVILLSGGKSNDNANSTLPAPIGPN